MLGLARLVLQHGIAVGVAILEAHQRAGRRRIVVALVWRALFMDDPPQHLTIGMHGRRRQRGRSHTAREEQGRQDEQAAAQKAKSRVQSVHPGDREAVMAL